MNSIDDTIAAIATPIGEGGISVVRVSGDKAIEVIDKCFRGTKSLRSARAQTAHFGHFVNLEEEMIDDIVAIVFKAPNSYTAEDVVEISCHGGIYITRSILQAILNLGIRHAEPGEFTKRAYLNGRIDLSQAEAVADLIKSRSEISRRISFSQIQGRLSNKVNEIKGKLLNFSSLIELELDFADEGIEFTNKDKLAKELTSIIHDLTSLKESFNAGRIFRDGVKIVLVGKPNVGKSSILNSLLSTDRAIVTEVPGTTRDTIEENLVIDGLLFKIVDTAGLRESNNIVEVAGLKRTEREIESADLIVFVVAANDNSFEADEIIFKKMLNHTNNKKKIIIAINKIDLVKRDAYDIPIKIVAFPHVKISAITREGFPILRKAMVDIMTNVKNLISEKSPTIINDRHYNCVKKAIKNLNFANTGLMENKSNEFIAIDLRAAMDNLSEITGTITTDEILNNIFSKFCIGK